MYNRIKLQNAKSEYHTNASNADGISQTKLFLCKPNKLHHFRPILHSLESMSRLNSTSRANIFFANFEETF